MVVQISLMNFDGTDDNTLSNISLDNDFSVSHGFILIQILTYWT